MTAVYTQQANEMGILIFAFIVSLPFWIMIYQNIKQTIKINTKEDNIMSKFMDIDTSFQIVYELAKDNMLTEREVQQEIELKMNMIVNSWQ